MSIELVFGDALAAIQLFDAMPDFRGARFPILREPAILFLLGFQQTVQDFFDATRACRLELFSDPGFQLRIPDFDVQGPLLTPKAHNSLSS